MEEITVEQYNIDKMLDKHGIHYGLEDLDKYDIEIEKLDSHNMNELKKIIIERRLKRQKDLLVGLVTGNTDMEHLEKIFQTALHEADQQMSIKHSIETKAGMVLTFFGVMVSLLFQSKDIIEVLRRIFAEEGLTIFKMVASFIEVGWFVSCLMLILFTFLTLKGYRYSVFLLDDAVLNAASEDENISLVAWIETAWNVTNRNTALNDRKGRYFNRMIQSLLGFILFIVAFFIMLAFRQYM